MINKDKKNNCKMNFKYCANCRGKQRCHRFTRLMKKAVKIIWCSWTCSGVIYPNYIRNAIKISKYRRSYISAYKWLNCCVPCTRKASFTGMWSPIISVLELRRRRKILFISLILGFPNATWIRMASIYRRKQTINFVERKFTEA